MSVAKEIRSKIKSIEGTKKITRAMEMVAASKMKRAQQMMLGARPYTNQIRSVIAHILATQPHYQHAFFEERPVRKVAYIVISSKRGLCGGLNVNLFKKILNQLKLNEEQAIENKACLVGLKAINFFNQVAIDPLATLELEGDLPSLEELIGLIGVGLRAFENKDIDELYICYNNFVNSMTITPTIERLLPLKIDKAAVALSDEYVYEGDPLEILNQFLSRYIEAIIYQAILENFTSEQASRMVAMKAASDNAVAIIDDLKLAYNKARQAAITREISEIVGGAAALKV